MRSTTAGLAALGLVATAGCGAASTAHPTLNPTVSASAGGTCATSAAGVPLPGDVTTRVPLPAASALISDTTRADGLRVVSFVTTNSLRQGILFILERYPKAGFVLGRGDAETFEADAPFASADGTFRGAVRLTSTQPCSTTWLLAYATGAAGPTAPVLPTYTPTSGATALPFS